MVRGRAPRVLVFGAGRSGTTWTAKILAATRGAQLANEIDTVASSVYAVKALRGLTHHPVLGADSVATAEYARLWDNVVGYGARPLVPGRNWVARRILRSLSFDKRRAAVRVDPPRLSVRHRLGRSLTQPPRLDPARPVVAKTVVSIFALEWILARWHPTPIWVRRHPLDVVAGKVALPFPRDARDVWWRLRETDRVPAWCPPPPENEDAVAEAAWFAGLAMSTCQDVARDHNDVIVVDHEMLCGDPVAEFSALSTRAGLVWTDHTHAVLAASDRPGQGWSTNRVTAEQPGRWRTRLTPDQQQTAIRVLAPFPIAGGYADLA
jgi:hypothetical protein